MRRSITALALFAMLSAQALALDLTTAAKQAEAQSASGRHIEAIATMEAAVDAVWRAAPLSFRKALLVAEPPSGFGAYNPREGNQYASGEQMIVYAEPIGYDWRKSGDIYRIDLAIDAAILDKSGKELWSKKDFGRMEIGSRVRNHEFMLKVTYTFTGVPPGEYQVVTTARDQVSGKSGAFTLPFVIRP